MTIPTHEESVIVVADVVSGVDVIQFAAVRVTRGGCHFVCCFCDTLNQNVCFHTSLASSGRKRLGQSGSNSGSEEEQEEAVHFSNGDYSTFGSLPELEEPSISKQPLSPVNCEASILSDTTINLLLETNQPLVIPARPCFECGYEINPDTLSVHTDGIIMATAGPCALHVQESLCKNPKQPHKMISDGIDQHVLLHTISTAVDTYSFAKRAHSSRYGQWHTNQPTKALPFRC